MPSDAFEKIVEEEFPNAIPEKFLSRINNVVFIVEPEPSLEVRKIEELGPEETLLGYYRGVPATARGDMYGIGDVLPDSIVLYQNPIEEEAEFLSEGKAELFEENVRKVVRETIWHEVGHHLGLDEHEVRRREDKRDGHTHE